MLAPDLARFMNLPHPRGPHPRFSPEMSAYQRFSPLRSGYPHEAGERPRHPMYRDPAVTRGHLDQAAHIRGQFHPQLAPDQWGWPRNINTAGHVTRDMGHVTRDMGHLTRDMGHVRAPASRYHQQPPRGQQTSVIRNRFVNSDPAHVYSDMAHVANRDSRHVYDGENYGADIKQEAASSSCSSDDDQQHIPQTVTSSPLPLVHSERHSTKVLFSTNEIRQHHSDKSLYLGNRQEPGHRVRDDDFKR